METLSTALRQENVISSCYISFSPDEVGADEWVEEGEDGGESKIAKTLLHFVNWQ